MSITRTVIDRSLHILIGPLIIPNPSPNTDYYIPATGLLDFRAFNKIMIVVEANVAVDVFLQTSYNADPANAKDLQGYSIPAEAFSTTARNSIALDGGNSVISFARIRIRTGTTAPTSIVVWIEAKTL